MSPKLQSIGPLAIGTRGGILYAADPQAADDLRARSIAEAEGLALPGTKDIENLDEKIAATLGTAASEISITDLKVDHKTYNSYIAVMRGQDATAAPALLRSRWRRQRSTVSLEGRAGRLQSVGLPNAPDANPENGRSNRSQSITNIAFSGGRVYVAGLSNEEFASKLSVRRAYPFAVGQIAARASRSSMGRTVDSRRGRPSTRSSRTRPMASPT